MAPPSQKYRPIGFDLSSGFGLDTLFTFNIRPEDLTRNEPSRLTVQQTIGGAWADAFGRGLATINLNGHCGWRGNFLAPGEVLFQELRSTVFQGWHDSRASAQSAGLDPSVVTLTFIDTLNSITSIVAPRSFTLRRSRTAPLLMRYQIQLIELGDASGPLAEIDPILQAMTNPLRWLASVTGIGYALGVLANYAQAGIAIVQGVAGAIGGAVQSFLNVTSSVIGFVNQTAQDVEGVFDATVAPLLYTGLALAQAGQNGFYALASIGGLIPSDQAILMRMAAAYTDLYCSMLNGFSAGNSYPSFDPLLGASSCSSTGGGDPWSPFTAANQNPWESIYTPVASLVTINGTAQSSLTALSGDPLTYAGDVGTVTENFATIGSGVALA